MYVNTITGQYPYTVGQFRKDRSNISFPRNIPNSLLRNYGVEYVYTAEDPTYDASTHKIVQGQPIAETNGTYTEENAPTPELVGQTIYTGRWVLEKTAVEMTAEEATAYAETVATQNRNTRNRLLAETDWMALTDVTMSAEMTTYRQALRDITDHANWPHLNDADWPVKP